MPNRVTGRIDPHGDGNPFVRAVRADEAAGPSMYSNHLGLAMKLQEIREIAKTLGLAKASSLQKVDLIRGIQQLEGNFDCFARASDGYCDQSGCTWRTDCLKLAIGARS